MTTVAVGPDSSQWARWMTAPGFLVGLSVADLWPGIGIWLGVTSLLLAAGLLLRHTSPRWLAWLAVVFRCGGRSWNAEGMARLLPPPSERFDPITARWVTPGGPLHDPQRDSLDPDHGEPVMLVDPIPRELADLDATATRDGPSGADRSRRGRWVLLAVVAFSIAAMLIGGFLIV